MLTELEIEIYRFMLTLIEHDSFKPPNFMEWHKFGVFNRVSRKLNKYTRRTGHSWISTSLPTHVTTATIIVDKYSPSLYGDHRPYGFYGSLYRATKRYKDNLTSA